MGAAWHYSPRCSCGGGSCVWLLIRWRARTGAASLACRPDGSGGHAGPVAALCFACWSGGEALITAGVDGRVMEWRGPGLASHGDVAALPPPRGSNPAVHCLPAGAGRAPCEVSRRRPRGGLARAARACSQALGQTPARERPQAATQTAQQLLASAAGASAIEALPAPTGSAEPCAPAVPALLVGADDGSIYEYEAAEPQPAPGHLLNGSGEGSAPPGAAPGPPPSWRLVCTHRGHAAAVRQVRPAPAPPGRRQAGALSVAAAACPLWRPIARRLPARRLRARPSTRLCLPAAPPTARCGCGGAACRTRCSPWGASRASGRTAPLCAGPRPTSLGWRRPRERAGSSGTSGTRWPGPVRYTLARGRGSRPRPLRRAPHRAARCCCAAARTAACRCTACRRAAPQQQRMARRCGRCWRGTPRRRVPPPADCAKLC